MANVDLFKQNLFSEDHKTTVLTLVLKIDADPNQVNADVNQLMAGASTSLSLYQIGMPLVSQALARLTEKDFFRLPPITFALIPLCWRFYIDGFTIREIGVKLGISHVAVVKIQRRINGRIREALKELSVAG